MENTGSQFELTL